MHSAGQSTKDALKKAAEQTRNAGNRLILLIPKDYKGQGSSLNDLVRTADELGIEVQYDEKNGTAITKQVFGTAEKLIGLTERGVTIFAPQLDKLLQKYQKAGNKLGGSAENIGDNLGKTGSVLSTFQNFLGTALSSMKIDELIKKQKSGSNVSSSELAKASIELINQLVDTAASLNNNVNSFSQQLNKLGSVLSNTKHLNGVGNKLQNLPNLDNIGAGQRNATQACHMGGQDPSRRISQLLRLITQSEGLAEAARLTFSSKGAHSPCVEGVNTAKLQAGRSAELQRLSEELIFGHYQPMPARWVISRKATANCDHWVSQRCGIVQRAMLMVMEPIWKSDVHTLSYGFRSERRVHNAICTVKLQLTDCGETRGRWIIEGDLSSYFGTLHHRLLMKALRRRSSDARFMSLQWKTIKAVHVDVGLFRETCEGVLQGCVISPLLSNIMLNEFDQYLNKRYLSGKARKERWYRNHSIQRGRSTAVKENWQWKPAVAYCRYVDDFVLIVKGTKAQAKAIREECWGLEDSLKLRLNMDKTRITHVNDGFVIR